MEPVSSDFNIDLRKVRVLRELRERGTISAVADRAYLDEITSAIGVAALLDTGVSQP